MFYIGQERSNHTHYAWWWSKKGRMVEGSRDGREPAPNDHPARCHGDGREPVADQIKNPSCRSLGGKDAAV